MQKQTYALVDSGLGQKLERFGAYTIARPCGQAVWAPLLSENEWQQADLFFTRETENKWINRKKIPASWSVEVAGLKFKISPTDFGHLGIFPEQDVFWEWIQSTVKTAKASRQENIKILNLFAYSGGATLAAAKGGAEVCHLDASKGMVSWARENAELNLLTQAPIRWIVDDVNKFLIRELRRGHRYDGIILDPPTFGRGSQGELFKIEEHLPVILANCRALLTAHPLFILFSCHTPGFTPLAMHHLMSQMMKGSGGTIDVGEMLLKGEEGVLPIPSGTFARWFSGF